MGSNLRLAPDWSWHDLVVSVWVSSGCLVFLPHQKSYMFGITNTCDIAVGVDTELDFILLALES